ncbi:FCD domain-containing protein [Kribbella catacumbae]
MADVTAAEHQAIRDAVLDRDPIGAEQAMRAHLENSSTRLLSAYDQT